MTNTWYLISGEKLKELTQLFDLGDCECNVIEVSDIKRDCGVIVNIDKLIEVMETVERETDGHYDDGDVAEAIASNLDQWLVSVKGKGE